MVLRMGVDPVQQPPSYFNRVAVFLIAREFIAKLREHVQTLLKTFTPSIGPSLPRVASDDAEFPSQFVRLARAAAFALRHLFARTSAYSSGGLRRTLVVT